MVEPLSKEKTIRVGSFGRIVGGLELGLSWSISLVFHLSLILAMALYVIVGSGHDGQSKYLLFENLALPDTNQEVSFDLSSDISADLPSVETKQIDSEVITTPFVSLIDESEINLSMLPVVSESNTDVPQIPDRELKASKRTKAIVASNPKPPSVSRSGGEENGQEESSVGPASQDRRSRDGASFFGSNATGKKFVFIVDSSSSMNGLRWRVATQELLRSINELMTDAEFFVICFDSVEHPIFNRYSSKSKFLSNDPKTFVRVQRWIADFRTAPSTYPGRALKMAIQMAPDAIFLLSDGAIQDNSIFLLREINHDPKTGDTKIPIHSILLMSPQGQFALETIANENGGTFRNITLQEVLESGGQF